MTTNLWISNHPRNFWQCQPDPSDEVWQEAIEKALPLLGLPVAQPDIDTVLALTLGEGQFGPDHWCLSPMKRIYYLLKPLLPRSFTRRLRQLLQKCHRQKFELGWPIEPRYSQFQLEVLKNLIELSRLQTIQFCSFWPNSASYALVLTHDIETAAGQEFVEAVAELEESFGFRSLFNFVPERYKLNYKLMDKLRQRGFEVGVHGLRHNGRLFKSKTAFMQNAIQINRYLKEWKATGFRAGLTHRQPEWMQALDIEYDLSFFDTDPFEPICGGTMSIWPFFIGHFVELPYTLVQDYTLTSVIGESSPRLWLEKVDFIKKYHGMALVNTHPDYLKSKTTWDVYEQFLNEMKKRNCYWHALPGEVAMWWKARVVPSPEIGKLGVHFSKVLLEGESIKIEV